MDGGEVEKYYRDGPIKDRPILRERRHNTYRVWLRYEGQLTRQSYEASGANLQKFLEGRNGATSETVKTIEADLIVRRRVRTARLRSSLIVNDFGNNSRLAVSRYYAREGLIDLFCLTSGEQCHLPHNRFCFRSIF